MILGLTTKNYLESILLHLNVQERVLVYKDGSEFKSNYNHVFSELNSQEDVYGQVRCGCSDTETHMFSLSLDKPDPVSNQSWIGVILRELYITNKALRADTGKVSIQGAQEINFFLLLHTFCSLLLVFCSSASFS